MTINKLTILDDVILWSEFDEFSSALKKLIINLHAKKKTLTKSDLEEIIDETKLIDMQERLAASFIRHESKLFRIIQIPLVRKIIGKSLSDLKEGIDYESQHFWQLECSCGKTTKEYRPIGKFLTDKEFFEEAKMNKQVLYCSKERTRGSKKVKKRDENHRTTFVASGNALAFDKPQGLYAVYNIIGRVKSDTLLDKFLSKTFTGGSVQDFLAATIVTHTERDCENILTFLQDDVRVNSARFYGRKKIMVGEHHMDIDYRNFPVDYSVSEHPKIQHSAIHVTYIHYEECPLCIRMQLKTKRAHIHDETSKEIGRESYQKKKQARIKQEIKSFGISPEEYHIVKDFFHKYFSRYDLE